MKIYTQEEFSKLSLQERYNFTGAIKWDAGDIIFYENGLFHRTDGPARIWLNGLYEDRYYINGKETSKEAVDFLRDLYKFKEIKL
jgi:hypothetical protein